ncbi:hypothetical protein HYU96_02920 [Candidatus Daviesbacteria bacterium]|nr:hypothetical protein [Candidatus Daviesbacteria bacterium]
MKILVILLFIASFLQASVLPLNLVLIILICRAYLKAQKSNLYLAFFFGLLISHLTLTPLGEKSLVYLVFMQIIHVLSKSRLAGHPFLIWPLTFILVLADSGLSSALWAAFVALPVFYSLKIWEERFIPAKEIKLRI